MKVFVAVPAHDNVPALFAYDLAKMMMFTTAVMPDAMELGLNFVVGTYVHTAREQLADAALACGADYILWIDADMRFPREALALLLQRKVPIVGVNYSTRGIPTEFVAIKDDGLGDSPPEKVVTGPDSEGIEEAQALGFGLVLMRTDVLKGIEKPFFGHEYLPERKQWIGEDVFLCRKLRAAGHRIFVDHELSQLCAHIGQFEYRTDHAHAMLTEATA